MKPHPLALLLTAALTLPALAAPASAVVPTQWIAKMYTEALGRIPDQTGWQNSVDNFTTNGCTATTLKNHGEPFYTSSEFNALGYDNPAKLLALYRGVLNREPDPSGLSYNLGLFSTMTWAQIVDSFFTSTEFNTLASTICSSSGTGSYSFNSRAAMAIASTVSESTLQSQLNSATAGSTVYLAQEALVVLTSTLNIPQNVTLATTGTPGHNKYALMGRLVRGSNFAAPAVTLQPGGKLLSIWLDGARTNVGYLDSAINLEVEGGTGTTVSNCLISNSDGWSSFHAQGTAEGHPCGGNTITNNLVTVYASNHYKQTGAADVSQWTDGLSIACENADVENNEVVDATDVELVLFRAYPAVQKSIVKNNTLLSAGNPAYGGITLDPLQITSTPSYVGSTVDHNTLWTSSRTHFDIGLSVGTRPWFGTNAAIGTGASATFNTTGTQSMVADSGIAVAGMTSVTVENNTFNVTLSNTVACPNDPAHPTITTVDVGASVSAGYASGSIQPYTDVLYNACMGH
jgi:hypothetical protein